MAKRCFYRVLPECDGYVYFTTRYNHTYYEALIANELLTGYMVDKHQIPKEWLERVYLDDSEWYYSFGARFQCAKE